MEHWCAIIIGAAALLSAKFGAWLQRYHDIKENSYPHVWHCQMTDCKYTVKSKKSIEKNTNMYHIIVDHLTDHKTYKSEIVIRELS